MAAAVRTEELRVPRGRARVAGNWVLPALQRFHDGRTDSARLGLLRILPARARALSAARPGGGARTSGVQTACLSRRRPGGRIPLRPSGVPAVVGGDVRLCEWR